MDTSSSFSFAMAWCTQASMSLTYRLQISQCIASLHASMSRQQRCYNVLVQTQHDATSTSMCDNVDNARDWLCCMGLSPASPFAWTCRTLMHLECAQVVSLA